MIVVDPIKATNAGEAPRPDVFDFQNASRASPSDQAIPAGGVPRALREAAEAAGLEPVAALYNEALRYAQEGHLRLARERLQMLLCMAPDDGEARLMLARVFVAGQRWSDALAALDEATSCGVDVPVSLRRAVEEHNRAEAAMGEERHSAQKAREQGEVKALRVEARRLRSENSLHACQIADLEREVRKWAWATASVSALTIVFIVGSLALGTRTPEVASGSEAPDTPSPTAPALAAPTPPTHAERAPAPDPAPDAASGGTTAPPTAEIAEAPAPDRTAPARTALSGGAVEPEDAGHGTIHAAAIAPAAANPAPLAPVAPAKAPPVTDALVSAALRQVPDLEPGALVARLDGDRVALTGEVLSFRLRRRAEQAIAAIPGIASVDASAVVLRVRTEGTAHVVRKGETLTHLAYRYYGRSTYASRIEAANGLEGAVLRIGQQITIPPIAR